VANNEVVSRDYLLEEIALKQWHADIPGGDVARRQLETTKRKLAQIGLDVNHPRFLSAYERVRKNLA
jgi:hypothetical protein